MDVTHDIRNIKLTAGEIAELFNAYTNNSATSCVLGYFMNKAQDPDVKKVIDLAYNQAKNNNEQISLIFKSINHPIPKGFSEEDVNLDAAKLYSDIFVLLYIRFMARFGLTYCSEARASCTRSDVREFFNTAINSTIKLFNLADDVLLSKGLFEKAPCIPIPEKIDTIEKQSFLNGFWGEKRALNASEINRLNLLYQRNSLGKAFLIGLCQTTKNKEIKDYFLRGKDISQNHMEVAGAFLKKENLPIPTSLDAEVTDSTETVFSDKLSMFHVAGLDALGLGMNGISLSRVMRRDLALAITRLMSEVALYAEDGFNIMIKNEWIERIPEAADRRELIGV